MAKETKRIGDIFAGLQVEVIEQVATMPVGKHKGEIVEVKEVQSKGTDDFEGTTNQLAVVVEDEEGRRITAYINLAGYYRKDEITSEMIEDVSVPNGSGITPAKWAKMAFEDKVEVLFDSYTSPEGDEIAKANYPVELNIDGESIAIEENHRLPHAKRTKDSLGKLMSMLHHVGVPIGHKLKGKAEVISLLSGKEIGVSVVEGTLRNRRNKAMLKVEYTMPASEVDDL